MSSTREEYLELIEELKRNAPVLKGKKKSEITKFDKAHHALIESLEGRIEKIDAEIAVSELTSLPHYSVLIQCLQRVTRAKKRLQQRLMLFAQAELRETRTRRSTRKPDYVYDGYNSNEVCSQSRTHVVTISQPLLQDEGDDYKYEDDMDEDDFGNSRKRKQPAAPAPTRRSGRSAVVNKQSTRESSPADSWKNWRGERRSARLGAPPEAQLDGQPEFKRARTEDSVASGTSMEASSSGQNQASNSLRLKDSSAAALKPTEVALEQIAGKKKSRFWVYAVDPGAELMDVDIDGSTTGTDAGDLSRSFTHDSQPETEGTSPEDSRPNSREGFMKDSSLSPIPMDTT